MKTPLASSEAALIEADVTRPAEKPALEATTARHPVLVVGDPDEVLTDDGDEAARRGLARAGARKTVKSSATPGARKRVRGPSGVTRTAVDRLDDPPPETGVALISRVSRAIERELLQIETIVGGHHVKAGQRTEAERRARTLASLARTLAEVRRLRAQEESKADDDAVPRNLDELRSALARRLDLLAAEAKGLHPGADDGSGDRSA